MPRPARRSQEPIWNSSPTYSPLAPIYLLRTARAAAEEEPGFSIQVAQVQLKIGVYASVCVVSADRLIVFIFFYIISTRGYKNKIHERLFPNSCADGGLLNTEPGIWVTKNTTVNSWFIFKRTDDKNIGSSAPCQYTWTAVQNTDTSSKAYPACTL